MDSSLILWPVLAQIILTIVMYILLGVRKARAVKARLVDIKEAALNNKAWPADVVKVSNNIANQFETPILFYVLCILLYVIGGVGVTAVALAWAYVLSRYAHAVVHVGSNHVLTRFRIFLFSIVVLFAMALLAGWTLSTGANA